MSTPSQKPARPEDVFTALDRTPYGELLRDTATRRRLVYEAMASGGPLTREIGEQLASGVVTPRALLSQPVYRDYFARALAAVECLDVHSIADCTAALAHTGHLTGDPKRDEVIAKAAQATSGLLGRRGETASYPHTRQ